MEATTSKFDGYEINPCRIVGTCEETGLPIVEQCSETDSDIAFWTVFGHMPDAGLDEISDHPTKEAAEAALRLIEKQNPTEYHDQSTIHTEP